MKSKATGCGSISTVFSSIVLLCVSSIIIIIIIIIVGTAQVQKTVLLGTARILRKVLEI